jgi:hypothetical protein
MSKRQYTEREKIIERFAIVCGIEQTASIAGDKKLERRALLKFNITAARKKKIIREWERMFMEGR